MRWISFRRWYCWRPSAFWKSNARWRIAQFGGGTLGWAGDCCCCFSVMFNLLLTIENFAQTENDLGKIILVAKDNPGEAARHFDRAIWLKPDFADAHYNRGSILLQYGGRVEEAIREFEQAVKLDPKLHRCTPQPWRGPGARTSWRVSSSGFR